MRAWVLHTATGALLVAILGGCGSARSRVVTSPQPVPVQPSLAAGQCADPERDGILGAEPSLVHADRDLDGDDRAEVVIADRALCTPEGNCHWNVFRAGDGCHRYLGTVSAARIQRLPWRGEEGFFGLRTWWHLTGAGRMLMQEYRVRRGGYRITDVLLCRQSGDDRILCAEVGEPLDP